VADIVFERDLLKKALSDVTRSADTRNDGDTFGTERLPYGGGGLLYPSAGYTIGEVELPTRNDGERYMICQPGECNGKKEKKKNCLQMGRKYNKVIAADAREKVWLM
jgi:hypothetical protein